MKKQLLVLCPLIVLVISLVGFINWKTDLKEKGEKSDIVEFWEND